MAYLITIRTADGERSEPLVGDLDTFIAALPDDEPMGVTAMVQP